MPSSLLASFSTFDYAAAMLLYGSGRMPAFSAVMAITLLFALMLLDAAFAADCFLIILPALKPLLMLFMLC